VTGDDRETCPGTRLVFDWYDIPTEQSFRRDLLKRRTNLKANPERLISRGKPRRQGSGNMMVEAAESCMFSFFPSLSKLYSTWKAQWMGASTSFERTSSDRLREHRQDSLFSFFSFSASPSARNVAPPKRKRISRLFSASFFFLASEGRLFAPADFPQASRK